MDADDREIQVQTTPTESQFRTEHASPARQVLTDEEIVVRVLDGDTPLFEVLMRRYNQRLYRAARAILRNDADAEDAVQQAYLNAYRHLRQFEGRARFSTWLTQIAVYQALAQRRRVRDKTFESDGSELVESAVSIAPDPEHQAYVGEVSALLDSALAALPAGYRSVFMLREVYGLSTADTAQQLHVTEGTVKTRLHRAKDVLQRKLQDVTPTEAFRFEGAWCDRLVATVMPQLIDLDLVDDVAPLMQARTPECAQKLEVSHATPRLFIDPRRALRCGHADSVGRWPDSSSRGADTLVPDRADASP